MLSKHSINYAPAKACVIFLTSERRVLCNCDDQTLSIQSSGGQRSQSQHIEQDAGMAPGSKDVENTLWGLKVALQIPQEPCFSLSGVFHLGNQQCPICLCFHSLL